MATEEKCELCGVQDKYLRTLKDGTKICSHCQNQRDHGFEVDWSKLTRYDLHYFDEIPVADENVQFDFEFEGFRADTKRGVFAVSHHNQLFSFKNVTKYYIKFIHKDGNSKDYNYTYVTGARLIIELNHPVISSVKQSISKDKEGILGSLVNSVFNTAAKNSYKSHNEQILELLKRQTGKSMSLSKKEVR